VLERNCDRLPDTRETVLERNCPANMRMVTGTAGDRGLCGWDTGDSEKPYSNDSNYTLFSVTIKFVGGKQTS